MPPMLPVATSLTVDASLTPNKLILLSCDDLTNAIRLLRSCLPSVKPGSSPFLEEVSAEVPMLYSQSPPLAEKEWLTAEETSAGRSARDPDARSDLRSGMRPLKARIHSPHPSRLNDNEVASSRPSIGRRMLRRLTRFSIAALIGVGATLGWQSYGDAAKEMVIAQAPALAWLLSISTTKSPVVAATSTDPMQ